MKQVIALLLAAIMLLSLAGCDTAPISPEPDPEPTPEPAPITQEDQKPQELQEGPKPQEGQFVFTRANFPILDGSTFTVPLAQAMAAILLSEPQEQVENLIDFSRTSKSYSALTTQSDYYGKPDLLLTTEPSESIWEVKAEMGVEWNMEPFAIDGLVFVVNADNPVDSLTVEQVQKIYTGEITNWSQVGGDDVEIIPFQRNEEAGSQTMMKKLVMGELPMMEPPMEYWVNGTGTPIEVVRTYEDSAGAIGYTVYYYANNMRMAEDLKILQIDGVEPSADSFRDKSYPFTNPYYAVMAAGLPEDDPTTILFNWILSEEGQLFVNHMGYVAVQPPTENFAEENEVPPVYANWSMLEKSDSPMLPYVQYWPEPQQELIPHDGYGMLIPFYGKDVPTYYQSFLFGLATLDGKVVVEPVYSEASRLYRNNKALPVLVLQQIIADEEQIISTKQEYPEDWHFRVDDDSLKCIYGLAAATGSWYIPPEYAYATAISPNRILLVDMEGKFWLCDLDGNIEKSPVTENAETLLGPEWQSSLKNTGYEFVDDLFTKTVYGDEDEEPQQLRVDFQTGKITYTPYIPDESDNYVDPSIREDIIDSSAGLVIREDDDGFVGVYDPATKTWVIQPQGDNDMLFINDVITRETYICKYDYNSGNDIIYNSAGELLFGAEWDWVMPPVDGVFTAYNGYCSGLIDKEGNWLMRFIMPSNDD